ncbi:MAG TPA: nucleotidyltransferase family protein [Candidatus Limnocylindrales bacterium]|nr:nucleotidyltransferase family protein [Candidatus Limnocylindrales bacterium]
MTALARSRPEIDALAALLAGEPVEWEAVGLTPAEFLAFCEEEDATSLLHHRLSLQDARGGWPPGLRDLLAREARAAAARELLRQRETTRVLDALAAHDVRPILLKGTPLAYTIYDTPACRPRSDTDLLVRRTDTDTIRTAMAALGYRAPLYCDGELLFRQFELARVDEFGVVHAFDFHWKISTQTLFADMLGYEELAADAVCVPPLGPAARAAGPTHTLLLACVHPAMHHRNLERLTWTYDVHLLAARQSAAGWDHLVTLARERGMGAITAHALAQARARFRSAVPDSVIGRLAKGSSQEASAVYLEPDRRWRDELRSNLRAMPGLPDRARLLREVLFPPAGYMCRAYGLSPGAGAALLPALYLHRAIRGGFKLLSGRK